MQSELSTDNESSAEWDFFTYEPSMFHIQSVIPYCYYYTSFCLYLLSICIGQSPPLSEPEYQEACNHGNLVEENSNDKESDINEDCRKLVRGNDQEIAEWVASRPHILNLIKILEKKPIIDQSVSLSVLLPHLKFNTVQILI